MQEITGYYYLEYDDRKVKIVIFEVTVKEVLSRSRRICYEFRCI